MFTICRPDIRTLTFALSHKINRHYGGLWIQVHDVGLNSWIAFLDLLSSSPASCGVLFPWTSGKPLETLIRDVHCHQVRITSSLANIFFTVNWRLCWALICINLWKRIFHNCTLWISLSYPDWFTGLLVLLQLVVERCSGIETWDPQFSTQFSFWGPAIWNFTSVWVLVCSLLLYIIKARIILLTCEDMIAFSLVEVLLF